MKKMLWTAVLALATTALPAAYADAGPARDFWRPKNLRQATVDQPSARSFGQGNCGHLVLDERRLRFFLSHARPATSDRYDQEMQTDDCNAEGHIVLKNGRRFKVSIDNWTGWGAVSDERTTQFLFCSACADILEPGFPFRASDRKPPGR